MGTVFCGPVFNSGNVELLVSLIQLHNTKTAMWSTKPDALLTQCFYTLHNVTHAVNDDQNKCITYFNYHEHSSEVPEASSGEILSSE